MRDSCGEGEHDYSELHLKCYVCERSGHIALDCSKFAKIKGNLKKLEQKGKEKQGKKSVSFNFSDLEINQKNLPLQISAVSSVDMKLFSQYNSVRKPSHMQRPGLLHMNSKFKKKKDSKNARNISSLQ